MKTEKPKGGAILTLMTAQSAAEPISEWVAENLGKTVVELKKPGGTECALEIYFDNTIEAEIALRALSGFPMLGNSAFFEAKSFPMVRTNPRSSVSIRG